MIEHEKNPARGRGGRHHGTHKGGWAGDETTDVIRQIAVHIDETGSGQTRLAIAVHLAIALRAELIGISSLPAPAPSASGIVAPLPGMSPTPSAPHHSASQTTPWLQRSVALKERFARKADESGLVHHWRTIGSGALTEMLGHAKTADLTILGQHQPEWTTSPGFRPDDIVLASGRPTLIVPPKPPTTAIGGSIVIAWDGSREIVRAIRDALPLLRDAHHIVVLEVDRVAKDAGPDMPDAAAAVAFLERHGFQAFVETGDSDDDSVAETLFRRATALEADLLVAGLFHHSRLRESLLGGVSQDLLRSSPLPILVSH